jgi:hypothetical protein
MNNFNNCRIVDGWKTMDLLCTKFIYYLYPKASVLNLLTATNKLHHICAKYSALKNNEVAVLLPNEIITIIEAWEYQEAFKKYCQSFKNKIKIYILSSSEYKTIWQKLLQISRYSTTLCNY